MHGVSSQSPIRKDRPPAASRGERITAGALSLGCLAVLSVGAALTPAREGHGTHEQLGMPACAWAEALNTPCLTCGMTTSFSYAGDGAFIESFLTQPMGFILVLAAATIFWGGAHVAITGSRLAPFAARMFSKWGLIAFGMMALGAWGYKIATWGGS